MTPAEELRAAAERLESLAKEADRIYPMMWSEVMRVIESKTPELTQTPYIAAMHPDVGKTLAEWLKDAAVEIDGYDGPHPEFVYINALAVARAINGTTP